MLTRPTVLRTSRKRMRKHRGSVVSSGGGEMASSFSSLPQYLCLPLISYLRSKRENTLLSRAEQSKKSTGGFEGSLTCVEKHPQGTFGKKNSGQKLVDGSDEEWMDEGWELLLLALKREIENYFKCHRRRKKRRSKQKTAGAQEVDLEPSDSQHRFSEGEDSPKAPDEKFLRQGRDVAEIVSPTSKERKAAGRRGSNNNKVAPLGGILSYSSAPPISSSTGSAAYLISARTFTELSGSELSQTVMSRLFGHKMQDWFFTHPLLTKWITVASFCMYVACVFPTSLTYTIGVRRAQQIGAAVSNIWVVLYLSSLTNWSVVILSSLRFEFLFMMIESIFFGASVICMQYVRYRYKNGNLQPGGNNRDVASSSSSSLQGEFGPSMVEDVSDYTLEDFVFSVIRWLFLSSTVFMVVLFCDGFSPRDKSFMRYFYTAVFIALFLGCLLAYLKIFALPQIWFLSHLNFSQGLTYTAAAEEFSYGAMSKGPHSIRLFDFWLNCGFTVAIFGFRMCINSFLHPEDCVFIKSRMKLVTFLQESEHSSSRRRSSSVERISHLGD